MTQKSREMHLEILFLYENVTIMTVPVGIMLCVCIETICIIWYVYVYVSRVSSTEKMWKKLQCQKNSLLGSCGHPQ